MSPLLHKAPHWMRK